MSSLSVDEFPEGCELEPHIARNEVIIFFHEVCPMTGIVITHQFQTFPHIVKGDVMLCGLWELGEINGILVYVFSVIVAVIDHYSLAVKQTLSPFVLSALAILKKALLGIGFESLDYWPFISIGSNGEKIDEIFVVGGEILNRKHIFVF
jgi:hypothetical protein